MTGPKEGLIFTLLMFYKFLIFLVLFCSNCLAFSSEGEHRFGLNLKALASRQGEREFTNSTGDNYRISTASGLGFGSELEWQLHFLPKWQFSTGLGYRRNQTEAKADPQTQLGLVPSSALKKKEDLVGLSLGFLYRACATENSEESSVWIGFGLEGGLSLRTTTKVEGEADRAIEEKGLGYFMVLLPLRFRQELKGNWDMELKLNPGALVTNSPKTFYLEAALGISHAGLDFIN